MLVLEGVLLVGAWLVEELSPLAGWGLEGDFVSLASVSFLLTWKMLLALALSTFRVCAWFLLP